MPPPQAINDVALGRIVAAKRKGKIAVVLNIIAVVSYIVGVAIIIGTAIGTAGHIHGGFIPIIPIVVPI